MNPDTFGLPLPLREKIDFFFRLAEEKDEDFIEIKGLAKEIADELEQLQGNQGDPAFELLKASIRLAQAMGEVEQFMKEAEEGQEHGDTLWDSGT